MKSGKKNTSLQLSIYGQLLLQYQTNIPILLLSFVGVSYFYTNPFLPSPKTGLSKEEILANLESLINSYSAWHVDRIPMPTPIEQTFEYEDSHINIQPNMEMNEWKTLSRLTPTENIKFTSLDMLGL